MAVVKPSPTAQPDPPPRIVLQVPVPVAGQKNPADGERKKSWLRRALDVFK
jgi:hypothetical protein